MKKVTVSAPSKLHLSGEHAVVYGKPVILVATSKRLYVTLEKQNAKCKTQNEIGKIKNELHYLAKIVKLFEKKYETAIDNNVNLTVHSDIPIGVGMGSSAALAVATIGALSQWIGREWNPLEINELAFEAEKIQHHNPSGGDNTIATYGGLLWYRKELDFLKTFWLLPFKIPRDFSSFMLINTGRLESTGELVQIVGEKVKKSTSSIMRIMSDIEVTTKQIAQYIHDENEPEFLGALKENQKYLEELGIVSTVTRKLIREIESVGGVAKVTGAGGIKGGSGVIIAVHKNPNKLIQIAQAYNFPSFQVQLGGEGLRREQVVI